MSADVLLPGVYDAAAVVRHMHENARVAVSGLYDTLRLLEQQGFVFAVMDPEGFIPTDDPDELAFEETEDDLHPYPNRFVRYMTDKQSWTLADEGVIDGVQYVTVLDDGFNPIEYNVTAEYARDVYGLTLEEDPYGP